MSGYIAELRRELVDAAERERRRSAPRRALARSGRPLAAAMASAVVVVASALGIAVLGREEPSPPAAPRVLETIRIGGFPVGATLGAGSVWVSDGAGRVLRVDPGTRRVVASVPVGDEAERVAATADAVWVVASLGEGDGEYRLARIDPESNRVVARLGDFGGFGVTLGAGPRAVWVQTDKQAPGPLRRVDPATSRIGGAFGRRWVSAIAALGGRLWTLSQDGVLEWRDAGSGRLLGRLPGFAARPPGGNYRDAVLPDADGAWVATGDDGAVTRVSAAGRAEWTVEVGANGPIALAGGSLWVTVDVEAGRNVQLARLDAESGAVTGRLRVGARLPGALLAVGDDLWAVLNDGTLLVVR